MENKGMHLAWIASKDFNEAIKFYTEVLGLKLLSKNETFNWAELQGEEGVMVGLSGPSQDCSHESPLKPGQNAVLTFTVTNIEEAREELLKNGTELLGEIQEVPGHVKLQLFKDPSGNLCHLCQLIA